MVYRNMMYQTHPQQPDKDGQDGKVQPLGAQYCNV